MVLNINQRKILEKQRIFGLDLDFPHDGSDVDVLDKLLQLHKFLIRATECKAQLIGRLETKDATRVRIKGYYWDKVWAEECEAKW